MDNVLSLMVPPKSVGGTDFDRKTGPPDQFWLPKSVPPTDFGSQNWSPFVKNGPHAKLKVYRAVAQTIIYKALK